MTDLERRALLGDAEAQRECTENGIVLPCPCCGAAGIEGKDCDSDGYYWWPVIYCESCYIEVAGDEVLLSKNAVVTKELRSRWNTRSAPPIGRCGECEHLKDDDGVCLYCEVFNMTTPGPEAFCCMFEPKGGEENG